MMLVAARVSRVSLAKEAPAAHSEPASSGCHLPVGSALAWSSHVTLCRHGSNWTHQPTDGSEEPEVTRQSNETTAIDFWLFFPAHWLFNWIDGCRVELIAPASPHHGVLETKRSCSLENEWICSLKRMFKQVNFACDSGFPPWVLLQRELGSISGGPHCKSVCW